MERSTFAVAVFLMCFFSLSHGIGRKMIGSISHGDNTHRVLHQETYELDYVDAGPNFNAHGGILVSPPPPSAIPPQPQD